MRKFALYLLGADDSAFRFMYEKGPLFNYTCHISLFCSHAGSESGRWCSSEPAHLLAW